MGTGPDAILPEISSGQGKPPIIVNLDGDITYGFFDDFGPVDIINLLSARGEVDPTGHHYALTLTNVDFARNTAALTIDGSGLAGDTDGTGPLQAETAFISTANVTNYNAVITTGGGDDTVLSGNGSDVISTGAGNDQIEMGGGNDRISAGSGDDYIENQIGAFNSKDVIDGGAGNDELSLYQSVTDADFKQVTSVEMLFFTGNSDVALDKLAFRAGVDAVYLDNSMHNITVGSHFKGELGVNIAGDSSGVTRLDASQASATITVHAEYLLAMTAPVLLGGNGGDDSLYLSAGFDGGPAYGGDLSQVQHFEHIFVQSTNGGVGATVTLATQAGEIEAKYQTVEARSLLANEPLTLQAGRATASIHVMAGAAADRLVLGSGDDAIQGGGGADVLTGGAGHNDFLYAAVGDSNGMAVDDITDFVAGKDKIDVTGIADGTPALAGQIIDFVGNGATLDQAAQAIGQTGYNNHLDAVFEADTHTLWFDSNDDGALTNDDLHVTLTVVNRLTGHDVMAGHVIV